MVYQQDGVIHHNAAQHDTADVGLYVKGGLGQKEHPDDADGRQRYGKHDHKRISQRLIEGRHHHVDKNQRKDETHQQFMKGFLLFLVVSPKKNAEISRHRHRLEALADIGQDRAHVPAADIRRHVDYPLLVFAFNKHRPAPGADVYHVSQHHPFSLGIGDGKVENVPEVLFLRPLEFYPNTILVSPLAVVARSSSGKHRLQHVGNFGDRQFHIGGLLSIHDNEFFRCSRLPADLGVRDTGHIGDDFLNPTRQGIGYFQIVAPHFHLDLILLSSADSKQKEPLACTGPDADPWDSI